MAAKGTTSKASIMKTILATFPGAFSPDGKEIRIPMQEDGVDIEIKVALTAAKDIIGGGSATAPVASDTGTASAFPSPVTPRKTEPSEEEKARVEELIKALF